MRIEFVALGEPMLEFNQIPHGGGVRVYVMEGFGSDTPLPTRSQILHAMEPK